jgi:hypothetical protein
MTKMIFNIFPQEFEFKHRKYTDVSRPYSYGGFLEHRTGTDNGVHLGLDITIPAQAQAQAQSVLCPAPCTVFHTMFDNTNINSWGGRVIMRLDQSNPYPYLLYGHLDGHKLPNINEHLQTGDTVGYIANVGNNGSWFRHLHVQQMSQLFIDFFCDNLCDIDGYGHDTLEDFTKLVCNPLDLISTH